MIEVKLEYRKSTSIDSPRIRDISEGMGGAGSGTVNAIASKCTIEFVKYCTVRMEVELVPLGAVPLGLVSSILLYGAGSGGEQAEVSAG